MYRNTNKTISAVALAAVLGASMAGTVLAQDTDEASGEPLRFGFIGPMTGEYGVWGQDHLAAAQLAADEWNAAGGLSGRPIEIVVGDSQGDGAQAAAIANQFVDEGIQAVIGPTFSLEAETSVPIFGPNQVISVTGLADLIDPEGSPGYYRTSLREDLSVKFAARLLTEYLEGERVAIVDDGKSDTVRTATLLGEDLRALGVEPIFEGSVTSGQQNYTPTLTQIDGLDPDVVFLATVNPESGLLRRQAAELGMDADFVLAAGSVEELFTEIAGELGVPSWSYEATRVEDRFEEFADKFESTYGRPPGNYNDYTYDAANVLFDAVEAAGSLDHDALESALQAITDYPGVTGPITFDETGSRGSEEYSVVEFQPDLTWEVVDVGFSTPE